MEDREFRELKDKVEDTHRMVSRLYKFEKRRRFWRVLKFVALAVIIVGAYYAILPFFKNILDTYNSISSGVTEVQNFKFPWQKAEEE
jgi:Ni,Fe-hydrogenase I cytochrome b subunit